ncbi:MAG TPA: 30S ribosomal protein S6 [bacterium]
MIRQYETTFILDAHLPNEQIEASVEKYSRLIDKNGGRIKTVERWGKRRLAYEIKKKQYGFYVHIRFESAGPFIHELERVYKLDDAVIRHLTLMISKQALLEEQRRAEAKTKEEANEPKPGSETKPAHEEPSGESQTIER